jgi:hypothetical protein
MPMAESGPDDAVRLGACQYLVRPVDSPQSFSYSWLVRPDRVDTDNKRPRFIFVGDKEFA